MSYSGSIGPINRPPPWRQYGFRSFQGLGFDRLAEDATHTFVFSISAVRGLPAGYAPKVPEKIKQYLGREGFLNSAAGWAAGGRVWGRYEVPVGTKLIGQPTERRRKVKKALTHAAQSLGPTVSFEVSGLGRLPAGAPEAPLSAGGTPTSAPASGDTATTVSVRELQVLLRSKGFNPGAVDGVWGPNTSGALTQAAEAAGTPLAGGQAVGSDDRRQVRVPMSVMGSIQALPARALSAAVASPRSAPTYSDVAPTGVAAGGMPDWLPWTLAAGGIAAVGGYFIWKGKRRRVRRNRRRVSRRR